MPDRRTILLVDDDRDVLQGATLRLEAAGYRIRVAHDGNEVLRNAVAHRPDAIVLDVRMPHQDGLSALAELQTEERTKDIPVVMLSASLGDQRAALEAGARFFLRKPYSGPMLVNAVNQAIEEFASNEAWIAEKTRQETASRRTVPLLALHPDHPVLPPPAEARHHEQA
jgi:CheY-like chemotaxis protein